MTLAERARKLKEITPLMKDREKLDTRDARDRELTLMEADIVGEGTSEEYAVVVFYEEQDKFLFAGMVLTNLIKDLKAQLEGEGKTLEDELKSTFEHDTAGELRPTDSAIRLKLVARNGKSSKRGYTDVEVL